MSINCFLNICNNTTLQEACDLIFSGHKLYLMLSFLQDLLLRHILKITYPDALTGIYPPCHYPVFSKTKKCAAKCSKS